MLDLQAIAIQKKCHACGYACESSESYCQACGENLKQRASSYR